MQKKICLLNVPSGSLAEDPDVYATPVRCSEYPGKCLERKEPQGPLRETLREHDENMPLLVLSPTTPMIFIF